jgi:hypothetical protein
MFENLMGRFPPTAAKGEQMINRWAIEMESIRPVVAEGICPICDQVLEIHAGTGCCPCCRGAYSLLDEKLSIGACKLHDSIRCRHWNTLMSGPAGAS